MIQWSRSISVCVLLLASGCPVPVPHYYDATFPGRWNVEKATKGFPIAGITTMDEVLLRLGEPDLVVRQPSKITFIYRWKKVVGKVVFPIFLLIGGGFGNVPMTATYFVSIEFDKNNTVQKFDKPTSKEVENLLGKPPRKPP